VEGTRGSMPVGGAGRLRCGETVPPRNAVFFSRSGEKLPRARLFRSIGRNGSRGRRFPRGTRGGGGTAPPPPLTSGGGGGDPRGGWAVGGGAAGGGGGGGSPEGCSPAARVGSTRPTESVDSSPSKTSSTASPSRLRRLRMTARRDRRPGFSSSRLISC